MTYSINQFVFWKGTRQPLRVVGVDGTKVKVEELVGGQLMYQWVEAPRIQPNPQGNHAMSGKTRDILDFGTSIHRDTIEEVILVDVTKQGVDEEAITRLRNAITSGHTEDIDVADVVALLDAYDDLVRLT